MKNKIILLVFLFSLFTVHEGFAQYLLPKMRNPKNSRLYFDFKTQAYYSHSNYTPTREYEYIYDKTGEINWISFADYIIALSYSPTDWVEFYPYVTAQTHYSYPHLLPFQFNDAGFILRHHIKTPVISLFPEVDVSIPLDPQRGNISRIITSNDVVKITPFIRMYLSVVQSITPFLGVGFQYRGQELFGLLLGQLGLSYQDHIWEFGFLFGGLRSVIGNIRQINSKKTQLLDRFNSGSLKFYAVEPEMIGFSYWVDFRANKKTYLFLNHSFDFLGKNYARGHSLNFGVKYSFLSKKSKKKYKKSIYKFREKTESIFREDSDRELMEEIENLQ